MHTENVLTMPFRFDYSANYEFNKSITDMTNNELLTTLTLDCEQMEYIDSVGIGLLVMAQKKAQAAGKKIQMTKLTTSVREVLLLTNMQKLIQFT